MSSGHSDRLYGSSVTIPRYYQGFYVNSFFPCTVRLQDSVLAECFPLIYDLVYNHGHNVLELYKIFEKFGFTTSININSLFEFPHEMLNDLKLRTLGN